MIYDLIRYFDMFAGIGGFRAGLTRAGGFQCIGHCEIDKYADTSYRAIHNPGKEELYYPDARTIDPRRRKLHILRFAASVKAQSFRCSSFQNRTRYAGLQFCFPFRNPRRNPAERFRWGEEVQGSVRGATAGRSETERTLRRRGYGIEWLVLNSKDFGVPQSRRRVYIVCYLDRRCAGKILPVPSTNRKALIQILGGPQGSRVYDTNGVSCTLTSSAGGKGGKTGLYLVRFNRKNGIVGVRDTALALNASNFKGLNRNQAQNAVFVDLCAGKPKLTENARCLTSDYGKARMSNRSAEMSGVLLIKEATKKGYKEAAPGDSIKLGYTRGNTKRGRVGKAFAHTLDTSCAQGIVESGGRIRRLMPRECLRLQGFAEDQIDRLLAITSDAQAYKQAGNSVTVNVIEAIGQNLKAVHKELRGST